MATVKFIIKKRKTNRAGEAPIFAQYTHKDGSQDEKYTSALFTTGKRVEPKYWDKKKGRVKRHENATAINSYLSKFENKIGKVVTELQAKDLEPVPERVKNTYQEGIREKLPEAALTKSLIFQWNDYLKSRINTISAATYSNQRNSVEALEKFLKKEKVEGLRPEGFTLKHFTKWEDFLNAEYKSQNSVAKRLKHFKAFLRYYQELGGTLNLSLTKIKYKETAGVKVYLTEEELEAFANAPVTGRRQEIRDLFVLQCNTGLRISDLQRVDKNINGNRIVITQKKTGKPLEIPISPTVRAILKKYNNQLPRIPDQKINIGIKEIYKDLFPDQTLQVRNGRTFDNVFKWSLLSTHDAVRTFITISAERGMPVNAISKITGKSIPVLLRHYLSENQRTADREFEKAWGSSPLRIAN